MPLKRHIPNALTAANLVSGCTGIIFLMQEANVPTAYFVWLACAFDFFDGFAARALRVSSPIGKELDSLADVVSFGVLPALALFHWISFASPSEWLPYSALLVAVCSALRLAKFNVDDKQSDSFIGLPTPANALFITALPFSAPLLGITGFHPWALAAISVASASLLVAPLPLFALKFKDFTWRNNRVRFTFLFVSVSLIAIWRAGAIPLVILLYVLGSFWKGK